MRHTLTLTALTLLLTTNTAQAEINLQPPVLVGQGGPRYQTHAYMGGQLMGIAAVAQSASNTERYLSRFGGGIGLFGGVRVSPYLSIEGNWTFALHDEAVEGRDEIDPMFESVYLMTFTADLKAHLPTNSLMEPYLQVGGGVLFSGGIYLDDREADRPDSFAVGATVNLGVGLDLWVTQHISMGARVLYRGLAVGEPDSAQQEQTFRNYVHGISVDAFATIHF